MNNIFIKFIVVGILNTAFGYGVFAILLAINLHYSIALAVSTILGVLFNFKTFGKIVFNSNSNEKIFRFIWVYIFVYAVNVFGVSIFTSNKISPLLGAAVMLLPCALLSFILQKKMVFNHE